MHLILVAGLLLSCFGLLTSTIFLCMVIAGVRRFRAPSGCGCSMETARCAPQPPVSLLKPLHGAEPNLEHYLESFFRLRYPAFEILFCARTEEDEGLKLARKIASRHPEVPVRFLTSGRPPWPNARCYSLSLMEQAASHDLLVITDSDVQVRETFLEEVVAPFADPEVGASTCLYVGAASNMGVWALLEGLGMSVEMASGVLVANMLEGMHFLLGPAMMVRRSVLEKFGGFQALGYYYADDFMLGKLVADSGSTVLLSNHVIDHCIVHNSFRRNFVHQWNWMKSTRFSRPWGHFGTALTFSTPFGILGFATAMVLGRPLLAVCLFLVAYLSRVALSMIVGWRVVGDPDALRYAWLYPARDLLGFVLWVASYTSRKVGWRDDLFILRSGGLMEKLDTKASASREVGTELPAGSHHK